MKKFTFVFLILVIYGGSVFAAEETIIDYSTYQTRLANRDIAGTFKDHVETYWKVNNYYLCQYQVYRGKKNQNNSWRFRVIRNTYDWGTIFTLRFDISNGYFSLKLSNTPFNMEGVDAIKIETGYEIHNTQVPNEYTSFIQESITTLKMNSSDYGPENRRVLEVFER